MPQLMPEGLPDRTSWSRYDFTEWTDGEAWQFVRGEDYESSTDTFRYNVKRWAKANGFEVTIRSIPATDERGRPLPLSKADAIGLGVSFTAAKRDAPRPREA